MNEKRKIFLSKIKVEDFGPLKKAEISLGDFTFIVGPQNSGKTYLSILLDVISKLFPLHLQTILTDATEQLLRETQMTGISLVLVKRGADKAVAITLGANLLLDYDYVISSLREAKPKVLYVASGILGDFDFRLAELLEFCHKNHVHTVVDLTRPYQKEWNYSHPALPYIGVLHSNVQELQGVTGNIEPIDGLRWLEKKGVKLPIVSDGKFGATAFFKGKSIRQPAFDVNTVDPTGAGDAMCAGTAKKLLEAIECGKALEDLNIQEVALLLLFAQAAGAACVGEIGTTAGVTVERINQILREQGRNVLSQTVVT